MTNVSGEMPVIISRSKTAEIMEQDLFIKDNWPDNEYLYAIKKLNTLMQLTQISMRHI